MNLKNVIFGSIRARLIVVCTIPVVFFLVFTFAYLIPSLERDIYREKETHTRQMVEVALSILQSYYLQETIGYLNRNQAQFLALRELRTLRYGPGRQDYFWVNDFQPVLLAHPFRPELENQDVSAFTDPSGKKIFLEFVEISKRDGSGFVEYHWQYYHDVERFEPKLSYVSVFKPWDWIVGTGVYVNDIEEILAEKRKTALLYMSMATVLALSFAYLVARFSLVQPLRQLSRQLLLIGEGGGEQLESIYADELNKLAGTITKMSAAIRQREHSLQESEKKLKLYTEELVAQTGELERLNNQLEEELNKARQIHEKILPLALPEAEGVSLATHYHPAQKVGGDFYDVIRTGDKLIFYLSDVSGHGLDGAMLSIFVKHTIKNYISFTNPASLGPSQIVSYLARQFGKENYPDEYFICIFVAVLKLPEMELSYCGAGFQDKMLVKLGNGEEKELTGEGLLITSHLPDEMVHYEEERLTLTPGTTIFCNTDGLTEQENNGAYYMERLTEVFYKNAHLAPHLIAEAVLDDFRLFNGGSLQGKDDITFLVLKVE